MIQRLLQRGAKRFIAGETITQALAAVGQLNEHGITATLDFLGEDVLERQAALNTRDAYLHMLDAIASCGARTNVSLKLTALGLLIDEDFALQNLTAVVVAAQGLDDPFVRIDMEGSGVLEATLRVFERAFAVHRNVGPVLQAYLHRTPADVERAIELGARVRLCKGAYKEPPAIAFQKMPEIREQYLSCAKSLLLRGNYPGIATHDLRLIDAVKEFVDEQRLAKDGFEFQLLFGVRPELQRRLVRDGYRVRVYIPFGTHWAAYFYRRVMERRENLLFALRSIFMR